MKYRSTVKEIMQKLEELGFTALFPNIDYSTENKDVALSLEEKKRLAQDHYDAIEKADAIYFITPEGYMGTSCKIELGYAYALKKPIYFSEPTEDMSLDGYPKAFIPLDKLNKFRDEF